MERFPLQLGVVLVLYLIRMYNRRFPKTALKCPITKKIKKSKNGRKTYFFLIVLKNIFSKNYVAGSKTVTSSLITYGHTYRYTKVITEESPFRALGVLSLQPIIKERSNSWKKWIYRKHIYFVCLRPEHVHVFRSGPPQLGVVLVDILLLSASRRNCPNQTATAGSLFAEYHCDDPTLNIRLTVFIGW